MVMTPAASSRASIRSRRRPARRPGPRRHAVDAAIAANAVMGVVAPMMNGVGGDLFAIVYDAASGETSRRQRQRLGAGRADDRWLARRGITSMPQSGIHSVTVPGAVAGWALLSERFGRHARRRARARDRDRRGRRSGRRDHRRRMGRAASALCAPNAEAARIFCRRRGAARRARSSGTPISPPRIGARGRRARRVLPRRHRAAHRALLGAQRGRADRRRPRRVRRRMGRRRSRPRIAAGRSTSCRRTDRASPR